MTKNDHEKLLASYMEVWILYILRMQTDDEHALTVAEITERVTKLTGLGEKSLRDGELNPITKTVSRRLQELETMGNYYGGQGTASFGEAFYRVMGGQVKALNTRPVSYYFEPILSGGDVSMICAAIGSNHYLSNAEVDFLVRRENAACSYREGDEIIASASKSKPALKLPRRPEVISDPSMPPSKASITLRKIAVIQYAIKHRLMLRIIPGTYVSDNGKIKFGPKRDRESRLNPYAMICQNGQYYIVVTHEGFGNPTHYRVDRLYSVELMREENAKGTRFVKREGIPVKLEQFFSGKKFNADMYTAKYPLMVYSGKEGISKCEFLCEESAMTVAIDYFGVGDLVKIEDYQKDDELVKFAVFADYDNVKMFCIQQCTIVKPLSPRRLVEDVKKTIKKAIDEMDKSV